MKVEEAPGVVDVSVGVDLVSHLGDGLGGYLGRLAHGSEGEVSVRLGGRWAVHWGD